MTSATSSINVFNIYPTQTTCTTAISVRQANELAIHSARQQVRLLIVRGRLQDTSANDPA
jgi:hypothetical protein